MPAIHLVRHAQASYDTDDYDRLSELGARQCELLGSAFRRRAVRPVAIVTGQMHRHRQTAVLVSRAAGWPIDPVVEPSLDEFDHDAVLAAATGRSVPGAARLERNRDAMAAAVHQWAAGAIDGGESFQAFQRRVLDGLAGIARSLRKGDECVVVTSGGPIAAATARLLAGTPDTWVALDRATITSSVSVVVTGSSGTTLVSFNEHGHLPPPLRAYR